MLCTNCNTARPNSPHKKYRDSILVFLIILLSGCSHAPQRTGENPAAATLLGSGQNELTEAMNAIKNGHRQQAMTLFSALTKTHPEMAEPFVNLGLMQLEAGNLDAAQAAFLQASHLKPDLAASYNGLGIVYRQMGRFKEAEAAYLKALQYSPDYGNAHLNLGILYDLYLDKPEDALEHYKRYEMLRGEDKDRIDKWIAAIKLHLAKNEEPQR
jgi:Flp pilus assembly protein TadD